MVARPAPRARRVAAIAPFHVMELLARSQALESTGRSIIHMEVGEPDFPAAEPVMAAARRALQEGRTRYTPAVGIPALRQAIAEYYRTRYGVGVAPERILVTPGASGALQLATAVLVNPGQQVLMTDPGYPCNRHLVYLAEGEPVAIPVGAHEAYQLHPELVRRCWTDRTSAVLLASPANPTGTLVPREDLQAIIHLVEERGGRVIVDEIYHGLTYGTQASTALALSDNVFVVNSFSKYFGMTGWRLGWLVAPSDYVRDAEKLAQNLFLAPSTPAQYAALAAFSPAALAVFESRREEFQKRRDFLLPALRDLGFEIPLAPAGAFYLYADCSRFTDDSYRFAMALLENAGVAITPGIDFGRHAATRHVRFAYTNSLANLSEGVKRLRQALG
jgi:aspartate/methionine/tyrosine aminotransferase